MEGTSGHDYKDEAIFTINGKVYRTGQDIPLNTTLNTFIRDYARLSGTKYMCREGSCGSCVVNLKYTDRFTKKRVTVAVNSCLVPVLACHGTAVTTVEGIGSRAKGYNKIQTTLAHFNGSQCGYCSPGFVMSMYSLLDSNPNATVEDVEKNFSGNLCRCTGYRPILDGFKSLASNPPTKLKQRLLDIEESHVLCPNRTKCKESGDDERCKSCHKDIEEDLFDLDFSELSLSKENFHLVASNSQEWYRAANLKEIFQIFDMIDGRSYILLAGHTARGVTGPVREPDVFIDINNVGELKGFSITDVCLSFGSLTHLYEYIEFLRTAAKNRPNMYGYAMQIADHVSLVANVPIRNRATIGGNLGLTNMDQSFPSDVFLLMDCVGASITIARLPTFTREVSPTEFRSMDLSRLVVTSIHLPAQNSTTILKSYKIMPVSVSAVAIVNGAFMYDTDGNGRLKRAPSVVLSGINNNFRHAYNTENYLSGRNIFDADVLKRAISILWNEVKPNDALPLYSPAYRKLLATALFYKSILSLADMRADAKLRSGGTELTRPISSGKQVYQTDEKEYPLTQPIPKLEAQIQCAGEAKYVNDLPRLHDELVGYLILAKQFADLVSIDATKACQVPGVVAFYTAKDIPGINQITFPFIGYFTGVSELFSSGPIKYNGQPVGMLVAASQDIAEAAADLIVIKYKAPKVPLLSIQDVLESTERDKRVILQVSQTATRPGVGGVNDVIGELDVTFAGEYAHAMETPTCRVIPEEDGQFTVQVSTQTMTVTKASIAQVMGIPNHKIDCIVPRIGGSFGSKNTSQLHGVCGCTLAASKLQRPVRMVMTLSGEMNAIGKRTPFYATYKGKCDVQGKLQGMDINVYVDYGYEKIMEIYLSVLACIVSYFDPATWNINIYTVLTDKTPMLILRAPGFMEAMTIIEQIIDHAAFAANLNPVDVRLANSGDTIINTYITNWRQQTEYDKRKQAIDQFNSENRWKKKGIALTGIKYPIVYTGNQIGCTVGILYPDGTVQVQHGGVEMGQGINTKVAQVVANRLNLDLNMIQVKQPSTLNCPNSTPTWGSLGSELAVLSALQCCDIINNALAPVRRTLTNPTWQQVVSAAFNMSVPLVACVPVPVFPTTPSYGAYFVYGVAVTETQIDVLTGQSQITRVDILEDVGRSMSPEVDVGQVEGGFIMALGLLTCERLVYDPKTAALLTDRLWFYQIPRALDIPIDFRITFIPNATNPNGVLNSKATGEPSVAMGVSVINSFRNALMSARSDSGLPSRWFNLASPCTPETILLASGTTKEQFKLYN